MPFFLLYSFYMTIKIRNRLFLFLFAAGIAIFSINAMLLLYAAFNNLLESPTVLVRMNHIFKYSYIAALASIMFLLFSAPIVSLVVLRGFEKTSCLEILFFTGVILSIFTEGTRLLIPVLDLWEGSSRLVVYLGRICVIGRVLNPLSLLFASLFSGNEQLENAERNLFFLFATSCAFGFFYPINSNVIISNCTVLYGMKKLYGIMRVLILITTVITTFINSHSGSSFRDNIFCYGKCLGIILFSLGTIVLTFTDSVVYLASGIILYSVGCFLYLKTLHYMANNWS